MHKWQLQEAKNKLSSLVDSAIHGEIQYITRRGIDAAVIIGIDEYKKLKGKKLNLRDFLLQGPKFDDLDIERVRGARGKAREIEL
jgi:prevent-host-death family protein